MFDFDVSSVKRVISLPRRSTSSWITTQSAPSGTGAPVKMRTAWPAPTRPSNPWPAAASPMTTNCACMSASTELSAYPSIEDAGNGGCVSFAVIGAARTRPAASVSGQSSVATGRASANRWSRASSTEIIFLHNVLICRHLSERHGLRRSPWPCRQL